MKIVLTGGGTGGHFYPIIAVAEKMREMEKGEGLGEMRLFYASNDPFDKEELDRVGARYVYIPAGKRRTYFSLQNIIDIFKMIAGIFKAFFFMVTTYPDAVFGKGGYVSFPVLLSARILGIPVFIHESDSVPGRVNAWAASFARTVYISFPDSASYFPENKTVISGRPILKDTLDTEKAEGAREFLHLEDNVPVIFILGGSQGADSINTLIVEKLVELTKHYYVIHQTGREHLTAAKSAANNVLKDETLRNRYRPYDFLSRQGMKRAASRSDLVISRAGSKLFEIAAWGKPSILIPFQYAHKQHQHHNAYAYARAGACRVIDESNLSGSVLLQEIDAILTDKELYDSMSEAAHAFHKPGAAKVIADALFEIGLKHQG